MIGRLHGILLEKQAPWLLIDVGGLGYEVEAPLSVFYDLPRQGEAVTLLTHLQVKEDGHRLYGFASDGDRALFRALLKVSGVGAKLALTILSGVNAETFAAIVRDGDAAALIRLPGVGKKTAERLLVEMRDRIDHMPLGEVRLPGSARRTRPQDPTAEAASALQALGYKPAEVARMVREVADNESSAEEIIRRALKAMVRR